MRRQSTVHRQSTVARQSTVIEMEPVAEDVAAPADAADSQVPSGPPDWPQRQRMVWGGV